MRYCVIDEHNKAVLSIDKNDLYIVYEKLSKVNKRNVRFYLGPDINTVHKVITEDELDLLLIEEKLRK
jgi:hypothetical protein